ncbi:hypothetical protein Tco_1270728, partial [Tanacetum coccineum]
MAIPNVPLPQGIGAGGSPKFQEAMGGSIDQTRSERVPTQPYDSPLLRVNTLGSDEGSMTLLEFIVVQESGELGGRLEANKEYAGVTLVTPTHSQEDQPEDQLGVFSAAKVLVDAAKENVHTYTRRRRAVSTASSGISTASRLFSTAKESVSTVGASLPVSTAGMVQEVNISIPSPVIVKDKGKVAVRLQEELDEEERQRMARVYEATQSFTEEEWENIRARV